MPSHFQFSALVSGSSLLDVRDRKKKEQGEKEKEREGERDRKRKGGREGEGRKDVATKNRGVSLAAVLQN